MQNDEKEIIGYILEIIKDIAKPDKIILFGSRATGKCKPESDFDFLVLKNGISEPRKLSKLIYSNLVNTGAPVDILVSSTERFNELKLDPYLIYHEIANHGVVLYEKEG